MNTILLVIPQSLKKKERGHIHVAQSATPSGGDPADISAFVTQRYLTEGRLRKNYFRKTSPGRVEMRIRRKTSRITPIRSFA